MELGAPIALVCVAVLAWDLGRKYLADRKQAYNARLTALLHEIDRERSDRIQQYADLRTVVNLKTGAIDDRGSKNFLATAGEIARIEEDIRGIDKAIERTDSELDGLRSQVRSLASQPVEPPDISLLVPDIAALVKRQGVLETAIKNLGIEARSELAQRVTKAELEGELKNVRTTQAGMLALGGRRR